jgi:hypothetical protein
MTLGDASLQMMGTDARLQIDQKDHDFVHHLYNLFYPIGLVGAPRDRFLVTTIVREKLPILMPSRPLHCLSSLVFITFGTLKSTAKM